MRRTASAKFEPSFKIAAVGDGVLRDQVHLEDAAATKLFDLAHDVVGRARALLAAHLRDDAERAGAVAALGDLHVGAAAARGHAPRVARRDDPVGRVADQHALGVAAEHGLELEHVARAEEVIDLGQVRRELFRVALREAAGDDELLARARVFVAGHLEDGVDRLLLGLVDEAAGVDDDHRCVFGVRHVTVARALGDAEHDLAVDAVLRAAEADEVDRALSVCCLAHRSIMRRKRSKRYKASCGPAAASGWYCTLKACASVRFQALAACRRSGAGACCAPRP